MFSQSSNDGIESANEKQQGSSGANANNYDYDPYDDSNSGDGYSSQPANQSMSMGDNKSMLGHMLNGPAGGVNSAPSMRHIPTTAVDQLELSDEVESLVSRDTIKRYTTIKINIFFSSFNNHMFY